MLRRASSCAAAVSSRWKRSAPQQPARAAAHSDACRFGGVEEADGDALAFVHQRRVAGDGMIVAREGDFFRQVAEIPGGQPFALEIQFRGAGEGEARGLAELGLELDQVAAARQLTAGLVYDAEIHAQVGGDVGFFPGIRRDFLGGFAQDEGGEGGEQRGLLGCGADFR